MRLKTLIALEEEMASAVGKEIQNEKLSTRSLLEYKRNPFDQRLNEIIVKVKLAHGHWWVAVKKIHDNRFDGVTA